jgi:signal transduction histidine kinase
VEVVIVAAGAETLADSIFAALFIVGLPVLVGRMFRSRSRLNTELRERARRLAADRQARAEAAAGQERRRIAGELHDLVAHGVSAMTVQAEAARRLVRKGDPRAAEAIHAVEDGGREALAELRRLLGVLRLQDADLALAPQPSLARVGALVERLRAEGVDARLEVEGERVRIGPGVDLAGYRVIEEALRDGAGGPVTIIVHYGGRHVDVSILGIAPDAADLVRLRERVRLFGGEVVPTRRGGVPALRAHLPLTGSTA